MMEIFATVIQRNNTWPKRWNDRIYSLISPFVIMHYQIRANYTFVIAY